jgi:hypothetical protein
MTRIGSAELRLRCLDGVVLILDERLEIALDCYTCQRRMRTVVFERPGVPGRCTPTNHEFPGTLVRVDSLPTGGRYVFSYDFVGFTDLKYPDECRYQDFEKGAPAWVRVKFTVQCLACQRILTDSTQSNVRRPHHVHCRCGAPLFEDAEPPILGWTAGH